MEMVFISNHGYERVKQRTHLKGKKAEQTIARIWRKGKTYEQIEFKQLHHYVKDIATATQNINNVVKLFGNSVYVFSSETVLITVLDVPCRVMGR